jgi:drug/metabolite transporter (DMT)-like permease
MTAIYTVLDGVGVRQAGSVLGYLAWLSAVHGLMAAAWLTARLKTRLTHAGRGPWALGALGGLLATVAYGLVIWAQAHGNIAVVSALRETSIVFAAAIGVLIFGEAAGVRRILAVVLVASGIALLRL